MAGYTERIRQTDRAAAADLQREVRANSTMGAVLGALGMSLAVALVVAIVGATGNIRAVTNVSAPAPTVATPADPALVTAPTKLQPAKPATLSAIGASAAAVPARIERTGPATVDIRLETKEVVAEVSPGETYAYWTFNGTVPGPMLRVRVGDTVNLTLANDAGSAWPHSIDLHAVNGPGGGATSTQTASGKETSFTFKALNPGLYVYHCATGPIPQHIANGMYGLILVEPEGGLPAVDREYFVVQSELYTNAAKGTAGHHEFGYQKLLDENPDYVLMNGSVGALTGKGAMTAEVGETVRIFYGVGGFLPSSVHLIGEIFDRVYLEAGSAVNTNVQTTFVPAGGAAMVEFKVDVPGTYLLVDHSLGRLDKGAVAQLVVTGPEDPTIYSGATQGGGH